MRSRKALSLIELIVVLTMLVVLAGILIPVFSDTIHQGQKDTTKSTLVVIRDIVADYWSDMKHVSLDGITTVATDADRLNVDWLFANPVTGDSTFDFDFNSKIGWRGPYVTESTGDLVVSGSPFLIDAWNNEITIQDVDPSASLRDVRIVSGGPDGTITIPAATATSALSPADVGDDIYVALHLR